MPLIILRFRVFLLDEYYFYFYEYFLEFIDQRFENEIS